MSEPIAFACTHCGAPLEARHQTGEGVPWMVLREAGTDRRHACTEQPPRRAHRPVPEAVSPAERSALTTLRAAVALGVSVGRFEESTVRLADAVDQLTTLTERRLEQRTTPARPDARPPAAHAPPATTGGDTGIAV